MQIQKYIASLPQDFGTCYISEELRLPLVAAGYKVTYDSEAKMYVLHYAKDKAPSKLLITRDLLYGKSTS